MYDVIVIGGGPSGLMACIAAGGQGASVLLIDKGDKLGRKLGISGGGRCNVTNNKEAEELIKYIPGNGKFLHSALAAFGPRDIVAFFERLGIAFKEEDNGRMFPVSDKAKTVVDALVAEVRRRGVGVRTNSPVSELLSDGEGRVAGVRLRSGEALSARCVVVAAGGKSVPHTGSTGDAYAWAEQAGHTVTPLFPTEVPLASDEPFIRSRELQGQSLRDVALTVWNRKRKKIVTHEGDMIFTHFGLSGPIALRCSQFVVKELCQEPERHAEVLVTIDLYPGKSAEELFAETMSLARNEPKKAIKNVLKGYLPERFISLFLQRAQLDEYLTYANIPKQHWLELSKLLKEFPVRINGTLSIEEAFVTGGGIHVKEIDPRTMGSKVMRGLYFCGEVLDVHGYTGGYNITAAFATGYTAGRSAAQEAEALR